MYKAKPVHREPNCRRGGRRRWIYGYRPSQSNYTLSPSLKKVLPIKTAFRPKRKRKKVLFSRTALQQLYQQMCKNLIREYLKSAKFLNVKY